MTIGRFSPIMTVRRFSRGHASVRRAIRIVCLLLGLGIPAAAPAMGTGSAWTSNRVALIQGTASAPDQAERNFARSTARRVSRWLAESGVSHSLLTDEDVAAGALHGASVAILCDNPMPPAREIRRLGEFMQSGGKLIVFYSADEHLADLMGVRLGDYAASAVAGHWSAFRFTSQAPPHVPVKIVQESHNIRPVYPAAGSVVIAWWEDSRGQTLQDPAWVQSPAGLWMSHVLLDDDADNKKQMLVALIGRYEPSVWRSAAGRCRAASGAGGSFPSFDEAVEAIRAQARTTGRQTQVRGPAFRGRSSLPGSGGELRPAAVSRGRPGGPRREEPADRGVRPGAAAAARRDARRVGTHRTGPVSRGLGSDSADAGAPRETAVFVSAGRGGAANYASRILPPSEACRVYGDQLAQSVAAAHKNGLALHAWHTCWNLDGTPPERIEQLKREKRLQVSNTGETLNWLCPSHPANLALELDIIREMAASYAVDGIHLDYIRYPGTNACFCAGCRSRFESATGQAVRKWPRDVQSGKPPRRTASGEPSRSANS